MHITSAQYYKDITGTNNIGIEATIDNEQVSVPLDTRNRHYQAIQEWVAEGNAIEDAD